MSPLVDPSRLSLLPGEHDYRAGADGTVEHAADCRTWTARCERIQLQERHDIARLEDLERGSYAELRLRMTHGDAIWYIDRARELRPRL